MRNTADVTGGKPIAVLLQPISGVSAINPLIAFYDIHGGKRDANFLFCPGDHTRQFDINANVLEIRAVQKPRKLL
jgi:prepilin-type processing-associated H-X9-DG protein